MNTKRYLFILFVTLCVAQVLAACGSPATPAALPSEPTSVPTSLPAPTATPEPIDPTEVVQGFWAAMEAGDVDAAMAFVADDAKCKGSCYFTGKQSFQAYLQGYINSGRVTDLGELTVEGDTVRYPFNDYRNGLIMYENSEPESMQIKDGKIIFWENLHQ